MNLAAIIKMVDLVFGRDSAKYLLDLAFGRVELTPEQRQSLDANYRDYIERGAVLRDEIAKDREA